MTVGFLDNPFLFLRPLPSRVRLRGRQAILRRGWSGDGETRGGRLSRGHRAGIFWDAGQKWSRMKKKLKKGSKKICLLFEQDEFDAVKDLVNNQSMFLAYFPKLIQKPLFFGLISLVSGRWCLDVCLQPGRFLLLRCRLRRRPDVEDFPVCICLRIHTWRPPGDTRMVDGAVPAHGGCRQTGGKALQKSWGKTQVGLSMQPGSIKWVLKQSGSQIRRIYIRYHHFFSLIFFSVCPPPVPNSAIGTKRQMEDRHYFYTSMYFFKNKLMNSLWPLKCIFIVFCPGTMLLSTVPPLASSLPLPQPKTWWMISNTTTGSQSEEQEVLKKSLHKYR